MINVSNPIIVFDPNEWLPSYGESRITLQYENDTLILNVFFENEQKVESYRTIVFKNPTFFHLASCPGVDPFNFKYSKSSCLSCLLEYRNSELSNQWASHFSSNKNDFRHYLILFHSTNQRLDVIASNVALL